MTYKFKNINTKLLDYIKRQVKNGTEKGLIVNALINVGWKKEDIDKAFNIIEEDHIPLPFEKIKNLSNKEEKNLDNKNKKSSKKYSMSKNKNILIGLFSIIAGLPALLAIPLLAMPENREFLDISIGIVILAFLFRGICGVFGGIGMLKKKNWGQKLVVILWTYLIVVGIINFYKIITKDPLIEFTFLLNPALKTKVIAKSIGYVLWGSLINLVIIKDLLKGKKLLFKKILIIALVVISIIFATFFAVQKNIEKREQSSTSNSNTYNSNSRDIEIENRISNWETYNNKKWGISFKYPSNFKENTIVLNTKTKETIVDLDSDSIMIEVFVLKYPLEKAKKSTQEFFDEREVKYSIINDREFINFIEPIEDNSLYNSYFDSYTLTNFGEYTLGFNISQYEEITRSEIDEIFEGIFYSLEI